MKFTSDNTHFNKKAELWVWFKKKKCHSYYILSWYNKAKTLTNSHIVIEGSNHGDITSGCIEPTPLIHLLHKCNCCSYLGPQKTPRACMSKQTKYIMNNKSFTSLLVIIMNKFIFLLFEKCLSLRFTFSYCNKY